MIGDLFRIAGRRVLGWMTVGALGGALLGLVELAIASFLLLFLETLGLHPFGDVRPAWANAPISLEHALAGVLVVAILRALAHWLTSQAGYEAQLGLDERLRRFALERALAPEAQALAAAELHRQLADTFPKASSAASQASAFIAAALQSLVIAVLMLVASPTEAVVGLAGLAISVAFVLSLQRRVRAIAERVPGEQRTLYEGIERVARNFVLVRVLGQMDHEHARLAAAVDTFAGQARRATRLVSAAYASTPLLGTILLVVVLAFSRATLPTDGTRLVAFLYLYVRFVQTLASAARTFTAASQGVPQVREAARIALALDEPTRARALGVVRPAPASLNEVRPVAPGIALERVSFRHECASHDLFSELSLSIRAGEQLAITGPSGSGKTTLLLIVLGFVVPAEGRVRIGDGEASELWTKGRSHVGFVGAEPYLVAGSLRDNLAYGLAKIPDDLVLWRALADVKLEAALRARSGGLDFVLDENGGGLSAGEQQRLSLARALLRDPVLLVLDEPSANLDAVLEEEMARVVASLRGRCTTIVVSHRPAMVAHADQVISLPHAAESSA